MIPRGRPVLFWVVILGLGTIPAEAARRRDPASPHQGDIISRIYVVRRQIFDTSVPSEDHPAYRVINALHVTTRERTIRQQLLLREGDRFDAALARESERALRRLLRLRDVRLRPMPVGPGRIDLVVEVQDTWSTEPVLSLSQTGEETKFTAGIRERNLLGYGKEASYFYKQDSERISRAWSYGDPALLGQRWRLAARYEDTADGLLRSLRVERPFYSSITPYAIATLASDSRTDSILYQDGEEVARYASESRVLEASVALSLKSTTRRVRRAGLGYRYLHDRLTPKTGGTADEAVYHLFGPTFQWERMDFLTLTRIRLYDREEDYNLGPTFRANLGLSRDHWVPGSRNAAFFDGEATLGRSAGGKRLGLATLAVDGRREGGWRDVRTETQGEYYWRAAPWTTWAARLSWDQIINPDPDSQLLLGGDTGLRGYSVNEFSGNRRLVANLENRLFLVDDVLKILSIGAVAFFDAGYAWPPGDATAFGDLRADWGAGLRIHLPRASLGQVIRVDLAKPLRSVDGQRPLLLTVATGQVF